MGQRLKSLVKNKLNMNIEFIGFIPHDDEISLSIAKRTPLILSNPEGNFARRIYPTAQRVIENDFSLNEAVFDEEKEDEVLQQLVKEFTEKK
jgi:flagellar biosynthesis protein FlhG